MELVDEIASRIAEGPNASNLAFLLLLLVLIVAPMLAGALRLPPMVGLVLLGALIGPHGFGILATNEIALQALGSFGLLYAMFDAGLELDLKQFVRHRRSAVMFALLSFAIPLSLGIPTARLFGYPWATAALLAACFGSHTMVTYSVLRKLGLARNRAVSTVVCATPVTAILVLVIVANISVSTQRHGSIVAIGAELVIGLVALIAWSIGGLPRVARWFFARVGSNSAQRFVFALGAFLFGAILAEAAGMAGIVGAFFAGLGLSRAIPARSPLMERVQFVGGGLFVPLFLISVGTVLHPGVLWQPTTLAYALVFTVIVLGGKALAAIVIGRRAGFNRWEVGVMSGLSGSQAAVTLATMSVGARLGIFDAFTINVVLVVVLATLLVTPPIVSAFGRKLAAITAAPELVPIGRTILVPVFGESSQPLLGLAGRLAEDDAGMVLAGSFVPENASDAEYDRSRRLRAEAEEWLANEGLEARSLIRISRSTIAGLIQTVRGERATMVVSEWEPESFGRLEANVEAREALVHAPVPMVLAHGSIEPFDRIIVVVARAEDLVPPNRQDLELARQVCTRLAHGRPISVVAPPLGDPITQLFAQMPDVEQIGSVDPLGWVEAHARPQDLVVLPGLDEVHAALERIPTLHDKRFLVAVAAA